MNKKQIAEMESDIARRTDEMRGRGMPDHIIRAMEKHVAAKAAEDAELQLEHIKEVNRNARRPSIAKGALINSPVEQEVPEEPKLNRAQRRALASSKKSI